MVVRAETAICGATSSVYVVNFVEHLALAEAVAVTIYANKKHDDLGPQRTLARHEPRLTWRAGVYGHV